MGETYMRSTKLSRALALVAGASLLAAACGNDDGAAPVTTTTAAPATTAPVPTTTTTIPEEVTCEATVPGSQVNYGVFAPNAAFDPVGSSGALVGGTEVAAVYDVLFTFDPVNLEVVPHLAESLTPDNAALTSWTLKLRPDIAYSDGTALDAQLVKDNMTRYFATDGTVRNTSAGFLQFIDTYTVVDELTLTMTTKFPIAELGLFFADDPGMIVNLNAIGSDLDAFRRQPVDAAGVGPYYVEKNVPGEEVVLKARANYWAGPVCIERIRFVFVPGAAATYEAFKNGELEVGFLRDPIVNARAANDGVEGFFFKQDGGAMLNFNHREGRITADPRVREAIMLAIDPEVINDRAYQGALETSKAYFGENSVYFSSDMKPFPTDTARAAQLVEEVKAEGWDGSLNFVSANPPPGSEAALAVEAMLGAVGITLVVELLPTGEQIGRLGRGEFDIITNGWNSGPDTSVLSLVRNASSTSLTNRMGYLSTDMDALISEALATPPSELKPVMAKINDQLHADFAAVTYAVTSEGLVWQPNIKGIIPTMSSIFLFHGAYLAD